MNIKPKFCPSTIAFRLPDISSFFYIPILTLIFTEEPITLPQDRIPQNIPILLPPIPQRSCGHFHLLLLYYFLFYQRVNYHSFLLGVSLSSATPDCPHGRPQNPKGSNKSSALFPGKVFLVFSFVLFPCAGDKIWLSVTL